MPKVRVEACYGGGERHYFRLHIPYHGRICREHVSGQHWNRETATEALNLIENLYHLPRKAVRFDMK